MMVSVEGILLLLLLLLLLVLFEGRRFSGHTAHNGLLRFPQFHFEFSSLPLPKEMGKTRSLRFFNTHGKFGFFTAKKRLIKIKKISARFESDGEFQNKFAFRLKLGNSDIQIFRNSTPATATAMRLNLNDARTSAEHGPKLHNERSCRQSRSLFLSPRERHATPFHCPLPADDRAHALLSKNFWAPHNGCGSTKTRTVHVISCSV